MKLILGKIWKYLNLPKDIQLFIMRFFQSQFLIRVTESCTIQNETERG